jgi:hypothetical protein
METQSEPVLWALGRERYTDLVLTFPLVTDDGGQTVWNTNWPKQPAGTLPMFLDNVITQLGRFQEYEEPHRPGVPKTLVPGIAVSEARVTRVDPPGGPTVTIKRVPGRELAYSAPEDIGLYEVNWGEPHPYRFVVNLFDANEGNIQPRDDVKIGEEEVNTRREPLRARRQLWPWLALAALGILALEWFLYQRRVSV